MTEIPDLPGFETYYGLRVSDIGEGGDVIILGHHHHEPLRVVAALNRHARTSWGCVNLLDDTGKSIADLAGSLVETHAVDNLDSHTLEKADGADWWIRWNADPREPGAFPVTMWVP